MPIADFIARQALQNPDAPAVIGGDGPISYELMSQRVDAAAALLMKNGVQPGDWLGLGLPQSTLWQAVFLLGALRIGARAVVLGGQPVADLHALPGGRVHTLAIEGAGLTRLAGVPAISVNADTLKTLQITRKVVGLPAPDVAAATAAVAMLSGALVAGKVRAVVLDDAALEARLAAAARQCGLTSTTRFLGRLSMAAPLAQECMLATWHVGGAVLIGPDQVPLPEVLERLQPDCVLLARNQLEPALTAAAGSPEAGRAQRRLFVAGGPLPEDRARQAQALLADSVTLLLSTAEVGVFCAGTVDDLTAHPQAMGRVVAGVTIRAVDPQGRVCPTGQAGSLQLHTPAAAGSTAAAAGEADQWSATGLQGTVTADGLLHVTGVDAALAQAAARSQAPAKPVTRGEIEEAIAQLEGVDEVCVLSQPLPGARSMPVVVFAGGAGEDMKALKRRIAELPFELLPFHLVRVGALPRGKDGAVLRDKLAGATAEAMRRALTPVNAPGAGPAPTGTA